MLLWHLLQRRTLKLKHKKRFFRKLNRVLAYVYMPILFSVIAYGIVYLMASDIIHIVRNTVGLILSDEAPDFNRTYESVFIENHVEVSENNGEETVKKSDVPIYNYGEMYAYIKCGRIALNAPVYKGDNDTILMNGIGQNFASSQPGFGRLILLCGHNNTYFNALKNIKKEDIIEIETSYGTYRYQVSDMKILDKNDESAYDFSSKKEQLVLYTCYPFDMLSLTQYRYFVYASLISGPKFVD